MPSSAQQRGISLVDGSVDLRRELVHRAGSVTTLTTREAALLAYLAARPGEPVGRDVLHTQVWGYHPTVMSRAIDTTVRRLRTKIEADPSRPVHLMTVHGVGYRFEPPRGSRAVPTAAGGTGRTDGLRVATDAYVPPGELAARLDVALASTRVVTLVGAPGVGKSRAAHELGRRRVEQGGAVFGLDLADLTRTSELCEAVARRLGVSLPTGDPVSAAARVMAASPSLWVLDDADRGVPVVASVLATWLQLSPSLRFLVTSRERLRIDGEGLVEVHALSEAEAAHLFRLRAAAADPGFDGTDPGLLEVVGAMGGNPLAVELAAARVRGLGLQALAARLTRPLQVLESGLRGRSTRRASLRGALDVSWELLDGPERSVLSQLTAFRGGFTAELAEGVVRVDDGAPWVGELLAQLVDRSLVHRGGAGSAGRFSLSAAVREHASERVEDADALAVRHVEAMVELGEGLVRGVDSPHAVSCLERLSVERANLTRAWEVTDLPDAIARLSEVLDALAEVRGSATERLAILDSGVERSQGASAARRATLLRRRGDAHRVAGHCSAAHTDLQRARGLADDPALSAQIGCSEAALAWMEGDLEGADAAAVEAAEAASRCGAEAVEARALTIRGGVARRRGDPARAEPHLLSALARARRIGLPALEAVALHHLASLRREADRTEDAASLLSEACAAFQALGQSQREAVGRHDLAGLLAASGELERAEEEVRAALALARRAGEVIVTAHIAHTLAHLRHRAGSLGEAERLYIDAIELLRAVDPVLAASARGDLAALQADRGQVATAQRALDGIVSELEGADDPALHWVLELHRGHVDAARARAEWPGERAEAHLAMARARLMRVRDADGAARDRCRMSVQLLAQTLERVP